MQIENWDKKLMYKNYLLSELALKNNWHFLKEKWFYLALALAPLSLLISLLWFPQVFSVFKITLITFIIMVIWQPLIEELFFRGLIQGKFYHYNWFMKTQIGFSRANWLVSLLFVAAHLFYHPLFWALAVFLPSLILGWFRDHYQSVVPAILLHALYNASFIVMPIFLL